MIVGDTIEAIAMPMAAEDHEAVVRRTGGDTTITILGNAMAMITVIVTMRITTEVGCVGTYSRRCLLRIELVKCCRMLACFKLK